MGNNRRRLEGLIRTMSVQIDNIIDDLDQAEEDIQALKKNSVTSNIIKDIADLYLRTDDWIKCGSPKLHDVCNAQKELDHKVDLLAQMVAKAEHPCVTAPKTKEDTQKMQAIVAERDAYKKAWEGIKYGLNQRLLALRKRRAEETYNEMKNIIDAMIKSNQISLDAMQELEPK